MTSNSYGPKSTAATVFAVALVVGYAVFVGATVGCNADRGARPTTYKTVDRFVPTGAGTVEEAPAPRPAGAGARTVGWTLRSRDRVGDKTVARFVGVGGQNGDYTATVYYFPAGTGRAAGRHMADMAEDLRSARTVLAPGFDADGLGFRAVAHGGRGTSRYALAARAEVDGAGRVYVVVVSRSLAADEDARDAAAGASERAGSLGESVAEAEDADRSAARPALTNADVD